jgi:hypothetical protein
MKPKKAITYFVLPLGLPIESIGRSVFDFGGETLKKIFK